MSQIVMRIPGKFWDSHVYMGRLYLFGLDGSVQTVNWDRLVSEWKIDEPLRLAMDCAFKRSEYLYGEGFAPILHDSEIQPLIRGKFERLGEKDLTVPDGILSSNTMSVQDSPFPFPHTDMTIFHKRIYAATQQGLFSSACNKKTKYGISTRRSKMWDADVLSVSGYWRFLALATGDDGLFEFDLDGPAMFKNEPVQCSNMNCTSCHWVYHSIYGSSHVAGGFLADYEVDEDSELHGSISDSHSENDSFVEGRKKRVLKDMVVDKDIFQDKGYSWGFKDKLCQASDGSVRVVRYSPWAEDQERLAAPVTLRVEQHKGGVVSGEVAVFGTVVEYDKSLVVIPSDGSPVCLGGEPVGWRVFPRSKHYENHLHVIYDDHLAIYSFNHDYFVDQKVKISGARYSFLKTP